MTGRDLIVYIMQHGLEDEPVFKNGSFIGFMRADEAAAKFGVGVCTINAWHAMGYLNGTYVGDTLYFLQDVQDPRKVTK